MKMAKPSEKDIDAAGDLISLLLQLDRGDYPNLAEDAEVPDWFDEDNPEHLRAFYDAMKSTLDKSPGYPGRVIGGMCYVVMYGKNEIVDPDSDVIELHPKLVKALKAAESLPTIAAEDVRDAARTVPFTYFVNYGWVRNLTGESGFGNIDVSIGKAIETIADVREIEAMIAKTCKAGTSVVLQGFAPLKTIAAIAATTTPKGEA